MQFHFLIALDGVVSIPKISDFELPSGTEQLHGKEKVAHQPNINNISGCRINYQCLDSYQVLRLNVPVNNPLLVTILRI